MTTYTAPNIVYAGFAPNKTYTDGSSVSYLLASCATAPGQPSVFSDYWKYVLINTTAGSVVNPGGHPLPQSAMLALMNGISGLANTN